MTVRPAKGSLKRKLLYLILLAVIPLAVANIVSVIILGTRMWRTTLRDVEQVTDILHDFVETTLEETILHYLRAKLETALAFIDLSGVSVSDRSGLSDRAALFEQLSSIGVATSGYVYIIDTRGNVVLHPDKEIQGSRIPEREPVRSQLVQESGYLEYTWQNTFEPSPLPKALYMEPYPALGWIVAATSYRDEFIRMVDEERIATTLGSVSLGVEGYSIVVARDGTFIAHPDYIGSNVHEFFTETEAQRIMSTLFSTAEGELRYTWPGRPGERRRPKLMMFRYLSDFDWVVGTTVYLDALRAPARDLVQVVVALTLGLLVVLVLLAVRMARSVGDPVTRLAEAAEFSQRAESVSVTPGTPREVVALVQRFNEFVDRIREQRQDVEEREARLQQIVSEKSVLIREIHHRVKNNLQVIASLLNLQAESVHDYRDAALFERSSERVISMALVHEQLHQADDLSLIPFREYLNELVGNIHEATAGERTAIAIDSDDIYLEIYRAVPCGLIVNELVTNAIQHAYPDGTDGRIDITFRDHRSEYVLVVEDQGEGMDQASVKSLGLTLVESLAQQLRATLHVSTGPGTRVTLTLPAFSSSQESLPH